MANKSKKLGGAAAHTLCLAPQTDRCAASIIKGLDMLTAHKMTHYAVFWTVCY
jgi:hypothetical protein